MARLGVEVGEGCGWNNHSMRKVEALPPEAYNKQWSLYPSHIKRQTPQNQPQTKVESHPAIISTPPEVGENSLLNSSRSLN